MPRLEAVVRGFEGPRRPVLVAVHGIGRQHEAQADAWADFAAARGMGLVAPCFDARRFDDFQRLGRAGRGARADLALIEVIDGLIADGRASDDVYVVGYSGGGQFAHRFAFAWPWFVRACVVVSAGWYTFPDPAHTFPYGVRASSRLPGVRFTLSEAVSVPTLVAVGERDVEPDENLRTTARVVRDQGANRVARARAWVDAMNLCGNARGQGAHAQLAILPGASHSFGECMAAGLPHRVGRFLDQVAAGLSGSVVAAEPQALR